MASESGAGSPARGCELLKPDAEGLARASARVRAGGCVAFPTETVYGLGADARDAEAVRRVFAVKGRPLSDPLIVHCTDAAAARALLLLEAGVSEQAFALLAARFWPGPLTLVGRAVAVIPALVTAGTGFVGVRVPANAVALALLRAADAPLAAPSANRFGHVSPTTAAHVVADLGRHDIGVLLAREDEVVTGELGAAGAVDESACAVGIESTVARLDLCDGRVRLTVLRRGGVSVQQLEDCLCLLPGVSVEVAPLPPPLAAGADVEAAGMEAPGMLLSHYAPDVAAFLVTRIAATGAAVGASDAALPPLAASVIIDFAGLLRGLGPPPRCLAYTDLSAARSVGEARRRVFSALRWAEGVHGAAAVLIADPLLAFALAGDAVEGEREHVDALRDRMYRAASGKEVAVVVGA